MKSIALFAAISVSLLTSACLKDAGCTNDVCDFFEPEQCTRDGEPIPCPTEPEALQGAACWRDDDGVARCDLAEAPTK